jgi:hypothetical protein
MVADPERVYRLVAWDVQFQKDAVVKQNFRPDHHGIWPRRIFKPCEMSELTRMLQYRTPIGGIFKPLQLRIIRKLRVTEDFTLGVKSQSCLEMHVADS